MLLELVCFSIVYMSWIEYWKPKQNPIMSKLIGDLKSAFADKSRRISCTWPSLERPMKKASRKLKLFRIVAEARAVHAFNHLRRVISEVKSTKDNVGATLAGKTSENDKMHPGCLNTAKVENNQGTAWTFDVASKVEQIHAKVFSEVAEQPKNNEELRQVDYYVCTICGNTLEVAAPERCPIWRPPKAKPFKVDQCGRL